MLFFDEISTAPPAVQAALLRVVLEREVGDLSLPPSVSIVAAANPPERTVGGWDLTAPLANRFCHLQWEHRRDDWVDGMLRATWVDGKLRGWPTPDVKRLEAG
jgi:MoxR-like ATPase